MKKTWGFYRSACIIDVMAIAVFLGALFYRMIRNHEPITTEAISGITVLSGASSVCFATDFLSIRLINKMGNYRNVSRRFHNTALIFYILLCMLFLSLVYLSFRIIEDIFKSYRGINFFMYYDIVRILMTLTMLILPLTSLVKIVFTWKLEKEVKENYSVFIASI